MRKGLIVIAFIFLINFSAIFAQNNPIYTIGITDFQSPVKLGDFLQFTYNMKSISGVNGSANISFWIQDSNENIISSGSDTIYLGSYEQTSRTSKIFLPSSLSSGVYTLGISGNYRGDVEQASRTIEININSGIASIYSNSQTFNYVIIGALFFLAVLNLIVIFLLIGGNKVSNLVKREQEFFKRHKLSFLIITFFVIIGFLIYYLRQTSLLPNISLLSYYAVLGALLILVLFLRRSNKEIHKEFSPFYRPMIRKYYEEE